MEALNSLLLGLSGFMEDPAMLIYMIAGVLGGMIFGAIPGLTAALGVSLMLPFTFHMTPIQGMSTLIGIYVGGISGGLVSAILLNVPGTSASMVTCFDGSPMARQGKPALALSYGITSSLIGGLFSGIILILLSKKLADVALIFNNWDYFAMGIVGLSVVVALCSEDILKGLIGAVIGMALTMVGVDSIDGTARFTFGLWQLHSGLSDLPVVMGIFVVPEVFSQIRKIGQVANQIPMEKSFSVLPKWSMFKGRIKTLGISSVIGTIIGIIPGVGQSTASLIAYNQARSMSKNPENFGKGEPDGLIASEAANNAVCGGAMIPMLVMGIPGDMVTALLLGGLTIHGLSAGPLLFAKQPELIGNIYVAYMLSCIIMFILFLVLMRLFIKVLAVPMHFLLPLIMLMCVLGTMTNNNRIFDSWVFLGVGLLAAVLTNCGISLPSVVLGYVLGKMIEKNFRTAIIANKGNLLSIFSQPIACGLLVVAALLVILPLITKRYRKNRV